MNNTQISTTKNNELTLKLSDLKLDKQKLKEEKRIKKAQEGIVFLLDVSGSMSRYVENKRKIDHLRSIMKDYEHNRKICFSDNVYEKDIPEPFGSTNMGLAFNYLNRIPKPGGIVLISDGLPDSKERAMIEAKKLNLPVDIIYIGEKGSEGEMFMKELAFITRGREFTVDPNSDIDFSKRLMRMTTLLLTGKT